MTVTLRFKGTDTSASEFMLTCARLFVKDKPEGKAGPRHGTAYESKGYQVCYVYWTKARSVVVIERDPIRGLG